MTYVATMKPKNRYPHKIIYFVLIFLLILFSFATLISLAIVVVGCPESAKRRVSSIIALKDISS